jgi:enoyl-CoA hydratase/carnithine racemase
MTKPLTDYVKLPTFEEYKEMFKEHADLTREDGILQVTMQTNGGPCYWSERSHNAYPILMKFIAMDRDNEVLIWTHQGPDWMQQTDPGGWEVYKTDYMKHSYFDDTRLIQNMVFDLEIPTIGAMQGPGFHWDTCLMCDITIASEDCRWDDFHFQYGLVPGDGMALIMQHFLGTKRANYLMYTSRQWDAKQALEWGWINEICPKDKTLERAWELAHLVKSVPRAPREITANLAKRPMQKLLAEELKLHNVSEQFSTQLQLAAKKIGTEQVDEAEATNFMRWRYAADNFEMMKPQSLKTWNFREKVRAWVEKQKNKAGK